MGWGSVVGSAIGAVGSIAGGLLSSGGSDNSMALSQMNYEHQKEFAQNGIRWKVADAKAAGLHPLAALGANTASYTPSGVIGGSSGQDYSWLGDAGQSIGRAVEAGMSRKERAAMQAQREQSSQIQLETQRAQLENQNLQNQALKMDMVRQMASDAERAYTHQQLGPNFPGSPTLIDGQGDSARDTYPTNRTEQKVSEVVSSNVGDPSTQAGSPPDSRIYSTPTGRAVLLNEDAGDSVEASPFAGYQWFIRNHLRPYAANFLPIDDVRRKDGEYFDLMSGEYRKGKRIRDYFGY
ncbi:minor capsid protein [Alces alces faeces associated microvirus MP21 4718]|uniref:minor capsid protein n=1 Tax=Alces alces faeces associated microvirus MP21 4718 TaxID=2219138 RepID=UPI000DF041A6|nr:minor capsid protein [Alces alces faeces associated microvirus MP21 4718]AXB22588.1 minor capsid protein [Alces alces faeces associated microvirus MP21 4718]